MTKQELKEEAMKEFFMKFKDKIKRENIGLETSKYYADIVSTLPENILDFIDSIIDKAYEAGAREILNKVYVRDHAQKTMENVIQELLTLK